MPRKWFKSTSKKKEIKIGYLQVKAVFFRLWKLNPHVQVAFMITFVVEYFCGLRDFTNEFMKSQIAAVSSVVVAKSGRFRCICSPICTTLPLSAPLRTCTSLQWVVQWIFLQCFFMQWVVWSLHGQRMTLSREKKFKIKWDWD
jgi:hypothetical protein